MLIPEDKKWKRDSTFLLPIESSLQVPMMHFVCLFVFLTSLSTTRLYSGRAPKQERLTILRAATHETGLGDHDFCLSRSHYTDTDPTSRKRAAIAGIEPGTSSPGVARSTDWATAPPPMMKNKQTKKRVSNNILLWLPLALVLSSWFLQLLLVLGGFSLWQDKCMKFSWD